jgi:trimethylamine---corrinoid protein Co-methyltransferase
MKKGLMGGSLKVLSQEDLHRIHEASLRLLEEVGMYSESDLILDIFKKAGAMADSQTRVIKLSPDMVAAALSTAPASFVLHGREPKYDLLLEPGRVYFGMGGTPEPSFYDYESRGPRLPTTNDVVMCTRVGHALQNIDFVMTLCSARDVSPEESYFYEYDALFRNTTKPVISSSPGRLYTSKLIEFAVAASGSEEEFKKRPTTVLFTQPVSPLRISRYSEGMVEAAAFNVPIMSSPGPMMGATSPASLAGTLILVNAEALLGIVLAQIIKPGTPVIYAPHTGVMDMVTAQCTYGSAEQSLARAAVAQLGLFYNLPTFGLGGGVEAKLPDAEAAAQAMMGMQLNALAGLTLTQTLGTMASGLYGSVEMAAICDEMAHMIKRILAGICMDEEAMAYEVIKGVDYGGTFLDTEHTATVFRQELFFPKLFRRQSIDQWKERGSKSMLEIAHERVVQILDKAGPAPLPDGADQMLEQALKSSLSEAEKISADM